MSLTIGISDVYKLYINSVPVHTWSSSLINPSNQWATQARTLSLNNGDSIVIGAIRGSSSTRSRVDWINIVSS